MQDRGIPADNQVLLEKELVGPGNDILSMSKRSK